MTERVPADPSPQREPLAIAAAALTVALMLPGIAEPYGGFLAYSEAWYTLVARNFAHGSLLLPEVAPGRPDFNIPPLFAWLLHAGFSLAGPEEWVAHLVAIAGAALGVFALALTAGPAAGFLLASAPAWVLVGRNVQPDGWAISLTLAAWAAWRSRSTHTGTTAGVLFGAALLVKPTVLLLPFGLLLAATLERRGMGWLERRHLVWASISALPTLAWTVLQLATHRAVYLAGVRHAEGAFEWPSLSLLPVLAREIVFAGFPVVTVLAPLAIARVRRDAELRAAALLVALGAGLFAVMHYHGYYLVAFLPAAAVLAGSLLERRPALATTLVAVNAISSLVVLGGHKLGRTETAALARSARGATFVLTPDVYDATWTLMALYGQPRSIRSASCATSGPDGEVVRIPPPPGATTADLLGTRSPRALALGGWALAELPDNPHRLAWGALTVVRAEGTIAGFVALPAEVAAAGARLPPGATACP